MKVFNRITAVISFLFVVLIPSVSAEDAASARARAYLNPFMRLGWSPDDLIAQFGKPLYRFDTKTNEFRMVFALINRTREARDAGVGGFTAWFVNNKLTAWEPDYTAESPAVVEPKHSFLLEHQFLSLVIVHPASNVESSVYLNTTAFPNLGYVGKSPDLRIKSGQYAEASAPTNGTRSVGFYLNAPDARRFKKLTTENIGARMAFMIGTNLVSAPKIIAPIAAGEFSLNMRDSDWALFQSAMEAKE